MRIGRVLVSHDLLVNALKLPEGSVVLDIRPDQVLGQFEMRIAADSLPDVPPGSIVGLTSPYIHVDRKDCGCLDYQWEWNL